ncbi:MAG TPA: methyltransferase domain-containing protein [Streptosporangiaceae bacterium]
MADDEPGGPASAGDSTGAEVARAALADRLRVSARASPAVLAAFREVPRHLFLPELPVEQAYQDEAFVVKSDASGLPLSSSSQPAMMAIMLEQLGLQPGHRVLEIGTGTGYNAALMARVTGPAGQVVSMDIDQELTELAAARLAAAGFGRVIVVAGDGGLGVPEYAPYDRIILTVGAGDLAPQWQSQLADGGRMVLPLSVRGIQLSVGLRRAGSHWTSTSACRCGFIRMAGAFAGPESYVSLGEDTGLHAQADDGRDLDPDALYQALSGEPAEIAARLPAGGPAQLADLDLWLTLTEPRLTRLTLLATAGGQARRWRPAPQLPFGALAGSTAAGQLAVAAIGVADAAGEAGSGQRGCISGPQLPGEPEPEAADLAPARGIVVRGYGPGGAELASHLAGRVTHWQELGRPGAWNLRLAAYPAGAQVPDEPGLIVIDREHSRLLAGWPW